MMKTQISLASSFYFHSAKRKKKIYIDNHQRGVSLPGAKESLGGGG